MTQARRRKEPREVSPSTPTMTIGEVLAVLKPEFADVTISKLRFLEGAGLVTPDRTAAGYRKFSQDDIERLRFVLRAQRDEYLPLRVIRQRLQELERAGGVQAVIRSVAAPRSGTAREDDTPVLAPAGDPVPDVEDDVVARPATYNRDELCKAAGVDAAALAVCESFGLLSARGTGERGTGERGAVYSSDDLLILRLCAELASFGLEPRHLRMYKTFADREAVLFEQVAAPLVRQRNPEGRLRARETVERLSRLCGQLHHAILRNALAGWERDLPP